MKFSINYFFTKFDQIRRKLWIWSHLLKKSLMKNVIFCAVSARKTTRKKNSTFSVLALEKARYEIFINTFL